MLSKAFINKSLFISFNYQPLVLSIHDRLSKCLSHFYRAFKLLSVTDQTIRKD